MTTLQTIWTGQGTGSSSIPPYAIQTVTPADGSTVTIYGTTQILVIEGTATFNSLNIVFTVGLPKGNMQNLTIFTNQDILAANLSVLAPDTINGAATITMFANTSVSYTYILPSGATSGEWWKQ